MTTIFCLLVLALLFGGGVWLDKKLPQDSAFREGGTGRPARVVPNEKPPASVNAFMGREPDMSIQGIEGVADCAIWITPEGELCWCPYVRPATPADGQ